MESSSMLKIVSCALMLQTIVSCSDKVLETPGIKYVQTGSVVLNVQDIGIVFVPDASLSKNKHAQEEAAILRSDIEKWVRSRFTPQGGEDRAVITVSHAALKMLKDKGDEGVHRHIYEGKIDVKIDILDSLGFSKASVSSSVTETVGIPETLTHHERKAQVKRLREELVNAMDSKIIKEISKNLPLYMMQ